MSTEPAFRITFWGTTGSFCVPLLPHQVTAKVVQTLEHLLKDGRLSQLVPGPDLRERLEKELHTLPYHLYSTYGGNTTCVEIQAGERLIVLDCGSGFRELGRALQRRWNDPAYRGPRRADILITHSHMDHTFATPFFGPYYDPRNRFMLWASPTVIRSLEAVLSPTSDLSNTYFPPTFEFLKAIEDFRPLEPGQVLELGDVRITMIELIHPGGCLGFRLERAGRACVFASDHEAQKVPDTLLSNFAHGADLLYAEGQYTEAEYEGQAPLPGEVALPRRGWGHTPMETCVRTAVAAGVRRLVLGHRDPSRSDEDLARLEHQVRKWMHEALSAAHLPLDYCSSIIPHEGMTLTV